MSGTSTAAAERRVALVLAASKGLGRACVEALADDGFNVAICARARGGHERVRRGLRARGGEATGVPADVSRAEDIERLFAHV